MAASPQHLSPSPHPSLWTQIFLPYAVGYFLSYLLRNVNAVMAPEFSATLGLSAGDLGLLTGAYLAAFACMQLPLGIALDRYGPRRVQALLLVVAAAGCGAFALGQNLAQLALARAMIGLGVAACLMAAFKTFSQWFPPSRLASLNAAIMVSGGLGALTASTPFGLLLPMIGWRWIFAGLAGLALLVAWAILHTQESPAATPREPLSHQLKALGTMLRGRSFWRFGPMTGMMIGGFIAIQSLWAVPWLMGINGVSRDAAAFHLLLLNLALMIGYSAIAVWVSRLVRRGFTLEQLLVAGGSSCLVVSLLLILKIGPTEGLWFLLGLAFSTANLAFANHAGRYPATLSGRANTCLNLAVFISSFGLQWGFGLVVDLAEARGLTHGTALSVAWSLLLVLQGGGLLWFVSAARWEFPGTQEDGKTYREPAQRRPEPHAAAPNADS